MRSGTYIGPDPALNGQEGLIMSAPNRPYYWLVQFDRFSTGLSYNWHLFHKKYIQAHPPVDWSDVEESTPT